MRSWKHMSVGLKLALAATAILALAIVVVLAVERFDSTNQDDAVTARETVTPKPPDEAKPVGKLLDLGTEAKISSNYRVAITEVSRYGASTGQLLAATVKATYTGKEDGEPWSDLSLEFSTPGSATSGEAQCPSGVGDDTSDRATLATGDVATYVVCLDVPGNDTGQGRITVEEAFTNGKGASWSTEEAVTKTLPSPQPTSTAGRPPATRSQPANRQRSNACDEFDEDKFEDYKEFGEQVKKQFKAYKDAGGDDEDKIEDYEEWEEAYDKQIDRLEKWAEVC